MLYDVTYMRDLNQGANELVHKTETDSHREQTQGYQGKRGEGGMGVWDQQMQAIIYRMDKQDPTAQHRELYSKSCNKPQWKRIYMYNSYFNKNKF